MKKIFKIIFIYLSVILLASIATVVFCAGFLFFYRDGNIFGIQYIDREEVVYAKTSESLIGLECIEINSEYFDVGIRVNSKVDNLIGAMNVDVFGYAKKIKTHTNFTLEYDKSTKTAKFISVQPRGWLNRSKSFIEIAIPESLTENGVCLIVRTSKADIVIDGNNDMLANGIVVNSSKGDVKLSNLNIGGNIVANIGSGDMYIADTCSTIGSVNAEISVVSGTVNFAKIDVEKFNFGVIEIKYIKTGKIGIIKTKELKTDGNINGGGRIEVGDVGFVDFESLDTDLAIKNINGVAGSDSAISFIKMTGRGGVWINQVKSQLEVDAHNGNVYVNMALDTIILSANQGSVKVDNAVKAVAADTAYGNIEVSFAETVSSYSPSNGYRSIVATTKNGHIIVRGLQYGVVTATDKGRISLDYDKVVGENKIWAKMGAVNIKVPCPKNDSLPNEFAFNLKVSSEVNCDIKVGVVGNLGASGIVDYSGSGVKEFYNIYNTSSSTTNTLSVSSSTGIIKIRSADLVGY